MPGFREYRAGDVWFYYNAKATKEQERLKELGSLTCRPVVIVQEAYYPEWNDTVTVVPMTSSDRRSGVYIETTILADGSIIEGGTVLPYIFYNIRCKYLVPITAMNNSKNKLLSISPEDYEKVREGYLYHFGMSTKVPDYVSKWKHLSDFDRNIVVQGIRLAVDECNDAFKEPGHQEFIPVVQAESESLDVENHILGTYSKLSADRTRLIDTNGTKALHERTPQFPFDLEMMQLSDIMTLKHTHPKGSIFFKDHSIEEFLDILDSKSVNWCASINECPRIFKGSNLLSGVELKKIMEVLDQKEACKLIGMKLTDIMEQTGVKSMSSASRMRKELREYYSEYIVEDNAVIPDPFIYVAPALSSINRSRCKRNAKRRRILFQLSKEDLLALIPIDVNVIQEKYPELSASAIRQLKVDIGYMYPDSVVELSTGDSATLSELREELITEADAVEKSARTSFAFWETLSPQEVAEIASASKKSLPTLCKKYYRGKEHIKELKIQCMELSKKGADIKQPPIESARESIACGRVIKEDWNNVEPSDLLLFCRTNYTQIAEYFSLHRSGNIPGKAEIAKLKNKIRYIISKK